MTNKLPRLTKAELRRLILAVLLDPTNTDPRVVQIRAEIKSRAEENKKEWLRESKEPTAE